MEMKNLMCRFQIESHFEIKNETKEAIKLLLDQWGCEDLIYTNRGKTVNDYVAIYFDYNQENAFKLGEESGERGNYVHKKLIEISEQIENIIINQNPDADVSID
jgi:hypothetical protein